MSTEDSYDVPSEGLRRLEAIIYVFGINKEIWGHVDEFFSLPEPQEPRKFRLSVIMNGFDLSDRVWKVLDKRYGFSRRRTFDEIATELGGLTRGRVQQIEYNALSKVTKRINGIAPLLGMDNNVQDEWLLLKGTTSIDKATLLYQKLFADSGWEDAQGPEIRQLLILLRALVQTDLCGIDKHLPNLSYAACGLAPAILKHPKLAEQERERQREQKEQERSWTYEELAEAVLMAAKAPLHYMEIASRAERLDRRSNFTLKAFHNVLFSNQGKFAFVGQGTYGLTEWGLLSVDAYTDIIAERLKAAGRPLPYGDILQSVNVKRTIKPQTLQMTLDMNARFYYSQEETYGLRAWLLPREKQTLRTPKWRVETPQSHERVQRAIERGYDVDAIVAQDRHNGV